MTSKSLQASLRGRMGAHLLHATHDSRLTSAAGRRAFLARFEREVDPNNELEPQERARRALQARKAYFTRLAYLSAKARARKARRRARAERTWTPRGGTQ